jgi:hypothetical protein
MMTRAAAVILLVLGLPVLARGEVRVQGNLDPTAVSAGETAVLTITVEGAASIESIEDWTAPDGLRVRAGGESRNISIVNGRMSKSIQKQYAITALRAGSYTFGPIDVRAGAKSFRVGPFTLEAAASTRSVPQQQQEPGTRGQGSARSGAPPVLVEMSVEPTEVTVGQQALLRVRFMRRSDVSVLDAQFIPPEMEGIWKESLPPERRSNQTRNGTFYEATEILFAVFPTRSGDMEITPARVTVQYRDPSLRGRVDPFGFFAFGGRELEEDLPSNPVRLKVKPLPQPKPPGFTGAVGSFSLSSKLDRDAARQGEPLTWTVEIRGTGNISSVAGPEFPSVVGCRGFDGGSNVEVTKAQDRLGGVKTLSRVLVPEAAGPVSLPALSWSYFDPEAGKYVSAGIPGRKLDVAAASVAEAGQAGGRIGGALRPPRPVERLHRLAGERPWTQTSFWVAQMVPLVTIALAYAVRLRQARAARDPVGARMRGAPGRLRRRLREAASGADAVDPWGGMVRAIEDYLADRFGQETRGMTREDLAEHLKSRRLPEEPVRRLVDILKQSDALRYTPPADTQGERIAAATEDAVACAQALERAGV